MKKSFKEKFIDAVQKLILTGLKPLFVTFILGNLLIIAGLIEKPSFKEWCIGTAFLLIGGGVMKVGKGYQDQFIKK